MTTVNVAGAAATAEQVIEGVMKFEPYVATIAGAVIPSAAPVVAVVQPMVAMAAPFVENALTALASGNNGDMVAAFIQLLQHITPGHPNAPILSPVTPAT